MKYKCEFCEREFTNEKRLINHMCEQKRRWTNRDEQYVRLGFQSWLKWYELSGTYKNIKKKNYKEFMESKFYIAFVKFGRHVADTNMVNPVQFIEYVIKNGIKLDNWCKDSIYEAYVKDVCKREDVGTALERQVHLMEVWAEENDEEWVDFFKNIQPNLAIKWIQTGRISPWILFNATTVAYLFERMSEEQVALVDNCIETSFWKLKMRQNEKDTIFVQETLERYGI